MKKYRFVKVSDSNGVHKKWYFYCDTIEDLQTHFQKYIKTEITAGFKEAMYFAEHNDKPLLKHPESNWYSVVQNVLKIKGGSFLSISLELENQMYQSRVTDIKLNGACLLTDGLSAMPINGFDIVEECFKDELIWPTYTQDDIKIVSWPGGTHFYAKIGCMDVVDDNGNQKWNTWDKAWENAKEFLNKNC